jgi:hypothetical protein
MEVILQMNDTQGKQPKKRVLMVILAAGIITATVSILGMAKVFNFP